MWTFHIVNRKRCLVILFIVSYYKVEHYHKVPLERKIFLKSSVQDPKQKFRIRLRIRYGVSFGSGFEFRLESGFESRIRIRIRIKNWQKLLFFN